MDESSALPLALLLRALPPALIEDSIAIVIDRLKLTPEKLALILIRAINPDELIGQGEEAKLRGIGDRNTLTDYKAEGFFPHFINGDRTKPIKMIAPQK